MKPNWDDLSPREQEAFKERVGIQETPTGFTLGVNTQPQSGHPFTIGDLLDTITELDPAGGPCLVLKEGIDLHAPIQVIGDLDQAHLTAMVSDDDGALCIMEVH